jgi:hypothetical protein
MLKKLLLVALFLFLILSVSAVNIEIDQNPNAQNDSQSSDLLSLKTEVQILEAKIDKVPTEDAFNENFAQLDASVNTRIMDFTYNIVAFFIGVLFLNNILLVALYVIFKSRGYI